MDKPKPAIFQLERFSIPQFSFDMQEDVKSPIDISLLPSAVYNTSNGEYVLVLNFRGTTKNEKSEELSRDVVQAVLKALFVINDKPEFENIPDFFYQNALAIIFPYLRAFVSNMTLQAGMSLMVLPLLNLVEISSTLKLNTQVFK